MTGKTKSTKHEKKGMKASLLGHAMIIFQGIGPRVQKIMSTHQAMGNLNDFGFPMSLSMMNK